jgi:hypothetical protein
MVAAAKTANGIPPIASTSDLHRVIGWKDAFWVASGVPALVLFSIGGIAATVGTLLDLLDLGRPSSRCGATGTPRGSR